MRSSVCSSDTCQKGKRPSRGSSIVMTHQLATWNVSTSHFLGQECTSSITTLSMAALRTATPCFLTFTILIYCCHTSFSVSFFIIKRKLFSCKANVYALCQNCFLNTLNFKITLLTSRIIQFYAVLMIMLPNNDATDYTKIGSFPNDDLL